MWTQLVTNPDLVFDLYFEAPDYDCRFTSLSVHSALLD
jgi:hypothetical protein